MSDDWIDEIYTKVCEAYAGTRDWRDLSLGQRTRKLADPTDNHPKGPPEQVNLHNSRTNQPEDKG